jgi:hypothetical protein
MFEKTIENHKPLCLGLGTGLWTSLNLGGCFIRTATAKLSQVEDVTYHVLSSEFLTFASHSVLMWGSFGLNSYFVVR